MARKMRAFPAIAALLLCAAVPFSTHDARSGAGRANESPIVQPLFDRAEKLCREVVPDATTLQMVATPLVAYAKGESVQRLWSIQIADGRGEYLGETLWDAASGTLSSAQWRVKSDARLHVAISTTDLLDLARMWIARAVPSQTAAGYCIARKPERTRTAWVLWADDTESRYRIKLDRFSGRLISIERRVM